MFCNMWRQDTLQNDTKLNDSQDKKWGTKRYTILSAVNLSFNMLSVIMLDEVKCF